MKQRHSRKNPAANDDINIILNGRPATSPDGSRISFMYHFARKHGLITKAVEKSRSAYAAPNTAPIKEEP